MIKEDADTYLCHCHCHGRGGIGIIRLSGPEALAIGQRITGLTLQPRLATFVDMMNSNCELIDSGIALYFKAPHPSRAKMLWNFRVMAVRKCSSPCLNSVLPGAPDWRHRESLLNERS